MVKKKLFIRNRMESQEYTNSQRFSSENKNDKPPMKSALTAFLNDEVETDNDF